jgi:hypothetical protein
MAQAVRRVKIPNSQEFPPALLPSERLAVQLSGHSPLPERKWKQTRRTEALAEMKSLRLALTFLSI